MGERIPGLHSSSRYRDATTDEELFNLTMTNLNDGFYGYAMDKTSDGTFKCICLSGFDDNDNSGASPSTLSAKAVGSKLSIWVRPLTDFGMVLSDPAQDEDTLGAIGSITLHKVFTAISEDDIDSASAPMFGQILVGFYEEGSVRNSNTRKLKWTPVPGEKPRVLPAYRTLRSRSDKSTALTAFSNGRATQMGIPNLNQEYDRLPYDAAKAYDDNDVPNKDQHKSKMQLMHPSFLPYAKAVIYDIHTLLGGTVTLASGFRSIAKQDKMYKFCQQWKKDNPDWDADKDNKKLPPNYGGWPAKPGSSNHNFGTACDFKAKIGKKSYDKSTAKKTWINSGIPRIINSYSLRWGGTFNGNYDPIHFDMPLSNTTIAEIKKESLKVVIDDDLGSKAQEAKAAKESIALISSIQLTRQARYPKKRPWLTTLVIPLGQVSSNVSAKNTAAEEAEKKKADETAEVERLKLKYASSTEYNGQAGTFGEETSMQGTIKFYFYPDGDKTQKNRIRDNS